MADRIPVIALTGYLGAGKTTVLNHLLHAPGARVGVIINDFGAINVDAALVSGQVDEPVSIAGGCLCCLADDETLDDALAKLARPRLGLDVIVVEASGVAEPAALARRIHFSAVKGIRPAGVVDVVDAAEYFATVDTRPDGSPPARFTAATLVVLNKCDRVPAGRREEVLDRIEGRVRSGNPHVSVVRAVTGRVDTTLLFDAAHDEIAADQLPFTEPHSHEAHDAHGAHGAHDAASSVTVSSEGAIDAGRLVDLLENPPAGAYRMKGLVTVRTGTRSQRYVVNLVGRSPHVQKTTGGDVENCLVAIGYSLDTDDAQRRLHHALAPNAAPAADGLRRLRRLLRLSS